MEGFIALISYVGARTRTSTDIQGLCDVVLEHQRLQCRCYASPSLVLETRSISATWSIRDHVHAAKPISYVHREIDNLWLWYSLVSTSVLIEAYSAWLAFASLVCRQRTIHISQVGEISYPWQQKSATGEKRGVAYTYLPFIVLSHPLPLTLCPMPVPFTLRPFSSLFFSFASVPLTV